MTEVLKRSVAADDYGATRLAPESSTTSRWAFINEWEVEPQPDDRVPMFRTVASNAASPSARRSTARRKHQAMFKEWSQGRHD